MIYKEDILPALAKNISSADDAASSHWKYYHQFF